VNPTNDPIEKRLVSFVHYSDVDQDMFADDVVLIRIGNLYVQYNRAKRYNIGAEMPNTVTITHAVSNDAVSDRLAALSSGEKFVYIPFTTSEKQNTLIVQVCSAVQFDTNPMDYAIIRIYYEDDSNKNSLNCNKEYKPQPAAPDTFTFDPTDQNATTSNDPTIVQIRKPDNSIVKGDGIDDPLASNKNTTASSNHSSDDRFVAMLYVVIPSILAVMLFVIMSWYIAKHTREQQKIMALQNATECWDHTHKDRSKCTVKTTNATGSQGKGQTMEEDLSSTSEDDDDDFDDLFVSYHQKVEI
jgi:hypothetical protein